MNKTERCTDRMNVLNGGGSFSCGMRRSNCVIGGVYSKQTVETVIYEGRTQQLSCVLRIVQRFVGLKVWGGSPQAIVVAAGLADARDARRIRHAVV